MLVFSISDKGGTGRTVTSCNIAYRSALLGRNVCYLDFDFGSPTAGAVFGINSVLRGTRDGGLHSYIRGRASTPQRLDVWRSSDRASLRLRRPSRSGDFVLYPGDEGGSEFSIEDDDVIRCAHLLATLHDEFDLTLMDLSAGRSYAAELVLRATAHPVLSHAPFRWLVFHRWTRQHVLAAAGLTIGKDGILDIGVACGHDRTKLQSSMRFVRTAVVNPQSPELSGLRSTQIVWLEQQDKELNRLAGINGLGRLVCLGIVPHDPVLQWSEQLVTESDTAIRTIANQATTDAFNELAKKILADWATVEA